jgi:predicted nucleic acid-binding protein
VISEYFNRVLNLEFDKLFPDTDKRDRKKLRKTAEFIERAETVRDECLNLLDDHSYVPQDASRATLDLSIHAAAKCVLDFTDSIHIEQCKQNGYIFVSHDRDFISCGVEFVTANRWALKNK